MKRNSTRWKSQKSLAGRVPNIRLAPTSLCHRSHLSFSSVPGGDALSYFDTLRTKLISSGPSPAARSGLPGDPDPPGKFKYPESGLPPSPTYVKIPENTTGDGIPAPAPIDFCLLLTLTSRIGTTPVPGSNIFCNASKHKNASFPALCNAHLTSIPRE